MASLGQEFKKERERKGISLRDIAEATKINLRFLSALEEDQYELLPGRFFTRGIVRSYAKYLGLDENAALSQLEGGDQPRETEKEPEHPERVLEESSKKSRRILSYSVLAVFLTAVLIVFFILIRKNRPESPPPIEQPAAAFIQEEKQAPIPEPETRELTLIMTFSQRTWIQIAADGVLQFDGFKQPGDTYEISAAESLELYTGNAGGFSFTLNGRPGRPLGQPGSVVRDLVITWDNYQDYVGNQ
jgi:transcriptional regulator with XRE-family HTH domain